ncbi:MAG: hypothetical protein APF77_10095 [Clostridia bacterium BRH_c25]|nr:MAG: hypothetical protein APF77_10095 [Clostridia bacterium BRH_c25]
MRGLFKLNFEKTAIFVLVLILLISTANISTQFFGLAETGKKINTIDPPDIVKLTFPVMLLKADELYDQGNHKDAQSEYLRLTNLKTISKQQKASVYFKLGLCNYAMELYDMAADSFIQSTNYNTNDAVAYNNAAVCAYLAKNPSMAESYQKKAIAILPAVEFHYNLGRVYESGKKYEDAVKYYIAAIKEEGNITRDYAIDPVLLNIKVNQLFPDKAVREKLSKELLIALKLKDARDVFIIEDEEMQVDIDFDTRIASTNGVNRLYCKYDRIEMDPYHLIENLTWTVKSKGREIYTSARDEFSIKIEEQNDYDVSLNLKYDNKVKAKNKIISQKQIKDFIASKKSQPVQGLLESCKYYIYAVYEQVFETDFQISTKGFTDRFGVVWGRNNIETEVMGGKDFIDAANSLRINNNSNNIEGIWADLSSLLESKQLKGKTINVKFYARKITRDAQLITRLRVKADQIYYAYDNFSPDYKWRQYSLSIEVPKDSSNLTFSLQVKPGEEIKVDGFIVSIVR